RSPCPGETITPDANAISHGVALAQDQIKPPLAGVHDGSARLVFVRIAHDLTGHRREHGQEIGHWVIAGIRFCRWADEQDDGANGSREETRKHGKAPRSKWICKRLKC